jgi:hypothetical protein
MYLACQRCLLKILVKDRLKKWPVHCSVVVLWHSHCRSFASMQYLKQIFTFTHYIPFYTQLFPSLSYIVFWLNTQWLVVYWVWSWDQTAWKSWPDSHCLFLPKPRLSERQFQLCHICSSIGRNTVIYQWNIRLDVLNMPQDRPVPSDKINF